jgi:hypothetical protein
VVLEEAGEEVAGIGRYTALPGRARRGDTLRLLIDPEEDPQIVREQRERATPARGLTVQIVERVGDRLIIPLQALVEARARRQGTLQKGDSYLALAGTLHSSPRFCWLQPNQHLLRFQLRVNQVPCAGILPAAQCLAKQRGLPDADLLSRFFPADPT